jgi:hypothetical protein
MGEQGSNPMRGKSSLPSSALVEMTGGFSMVHYMTFLSAKLLVREEDDPWGQEIEAQLKYGLGLVDCSIHNLSITWLTESEQGHKKPLIPVRCYLGRYFRQRYTWDASSPEGDLRTLAGKLEKTWLDEMVRELQNEV